MSTSRLPALMHAWRVRQPAPVGAHPLQWVRTPTPVPGPGEVLVRVRACGVCRTDLHVTEGDLPVHRPHVTPGHEVVGDVVALGPRTHGVSVGERVGIAWLRHTCGRCTYCRRHAENLCPNSRYTGWDADGGYAQFATAPADFVYRLPAGYTDQSVAPLLCAGIIGYRALRRSGVGDGGVLGLYGFGGSAHITAQVALARGCRVHALTRGAKAQRLALELGCASANGAYDMPPEPLDAAILFAPVGDIVPVALRALRPGGVLALAGIHLSDVPPLNYERELFHEKELRSVESNTRNDGREFLDFAAHHRIDVDTHPYPLDRADRALEDLKAGAFAGAAVLAA